jgi:hypothetical protein
MLQGLVFGYFWLLRCLTVDVNSVVEFLHCVGVGNVADVLEVDSASEISEMLPASTV